MERNKLTFNNFSTNVQFACANNAGLNSFADKLADCFCLAAAAELELNVGGLP